MPISDKKKALLQQEMQRLEIDEKDLVETFKIGSGRGGQKLHKTHSCVHLQHLPTKLSVTAHASRLREENRFFARRKLCELFIEKVLGKPTLKEKKEAKKKKQKKRRKRRTANRDAATALPPSQ